MKNINLILLLLLVSLSACRKNVDEFSKVTLPLPTPLVLEGYNPIFSLAEGDLTGFVFDQNNEPIAAAEVTLNNLTTTTDKFGHFFFKDVDMNADGTIVQIKKEGYFAASRRFRAVENTENRVQIEMITKTFSQTFESGNGGTVNLNGGGTIVFSAGNIQDADGERYPGLVKVASHWLDPSEYSSMTQMPGNLFGVNNQGEEVVLGTMGMVVVELESDSGEPLNILEGETAILTTPVPASLLSSAPAEIPLWSYNEEYGVWVEEGTSRLEGGNYVAEVSHFSYWSQDFSAPLVNFSAVITDTAGNPLVNYQVTIYNPNNSNWGSGHTTAGGHISGLIPADMVLDLEIISSCNDLLYSAAIGPFSTAADLGTIAVPASALNSTTVSGNLIDCNGDALLNGVAIIDFGTGQVYNYVDDGTFSSTFSSCPSSNPIEVTGYDLAAEVQSEIVTATENMVNGLGDIIVCDIPIQNYLRLTVDGETAFYLNIQSQVLASVTSIMQFIPNTVQMQINMDGVTVGDYSNGLSSCLFSDYTRDWILSTNSPEYFSVFEIVEYGNSGESINGYFSGILTNNGVQPSVQVEVTGVFDVIRD